MKAETVIEMLQEIKNTIFSQDYSIKNGRSCYFYTDRNNYLQKIINVL